MSFLSTLAGKAGLFLVLVVVGLIALAVVARNWSCRRHVDPAPVRHGPYPVIEVVTGASLRAAYGRRDRKEQDVLLTGIAAPAIGEPLAEESRASLEILAGGQVWIERDGAIIRERRIEGVVYGESGEHLQVAQLRLGWVRMTPAGKEIKAYRQAQAEAMKAKRGIWAVGSDQWAVSKP